jgi:hypothetical protein
VSSGFAGKLGAEVSGKIVASLAGAVVGGATAGGLSTAFYGGNFFENMFIGAGTSFAVASGFAGAYLAYTRITGTVPTWSRTEGEAAKAVRGGTGRPALYEILGAYFGVFLSR